MAPGYLRPSFGISYKKNNFSFAFSPVSGKITFMNSDSLRKVPDVWKDPDIKTERASGATVTVSDKWEIVKNITLQYNILIFANYLKMIDQYPDLNAEIYLRFYVNRFVSAFFNLKMIHNNDTRIEYSSQPGTYYIPFQVNYNLNIGFAINPWKFRNRKTD
jgi:hypothetical protein